MPRKEPTPIRKPLVPVPADEPQPIMFPKPALTDEQLRNLVASYVARVLHKIVNAAMEAEIVTMGEQEFEAFCRSVLESEE
jgi:hypothetical protein